MQKSNSNSNPITVNETYAAKHGFRFKHFKLDAGRILQKMLPNWPADLNRNPIDFALEVKSKFQIGHSFLQNGSTVICQTC